MLFIDGVKYKLWTPKDEEKEFHPMIKEHSKEIFGEDSIYFDVKHVLKSTSGIGSIPDAYVINLPKQELYVVENELATHPVYDHIVKQLTKFINGIENQDAKSQIIDMLYEEINRDLVLRATVQKTLGSADVYHFLSKLFSKHPRIVIIIDEKTSEVEEACRVLKYQTDIIEFKTFVREDSPNVFAHLFEPLHKHERQPEKVKEGEKEHPPHTTSWEKRLEWVDENIRDTTEMLKDHILKLGDVTHKPSSGIDYAFFKGKPSTKSIFAALVLSKKTLKVRIRTDPATFRDPKKWVGEKTYKWFIRTGQEKEFKITEKEQLEYAVELIKQSYDLAK